MSLSFFLPLLILGVSLLPTDCTTTVAVGTTHPKTTVGSTTPSTTPQPPDDPQLRQKLVASALYLANVLHKRFHKTQKTVQYTEGDIEENFVFDPLGIQCACGILLRGMTDETYYEQLTEFLGFRKVKFEYDKMFEAMAQFMYHEHYNVSASNARKVYLTTGLFANRDFPLKADFKRQAAAMFRGEIRNVSTWHIDARVRGLQEFVSQGTNRFLSKSVKGIHGDFDLMVVGVTYIRDAWLYPAEKLVSPKVLICEQGKKKRTFPMNTRMLRTWYVNYSDRYAIIVPFRRARVSILFYVLKNEKDFEQMDENMDYGRLSNMLKTMLDRELVRVRVTFPVLEMDYFRNLTYDMEVRGVKTLFHQNSVQYNKMTPAEYLSVREVAHYSRLSMTDEEVHFASVTYVTVDRHEMSLDEHERNMYQEIIRSHGKTMTESDPDSTLPDGPELADSEQDDPDFLVSRKSMKAAATTTTTRQATMTSDPELESGVEHRKEKKKKCRQRLTHFRFPRRAKLPAPLSPTLPMMRRPTTSGTFESSCVGDCTRMKRDHEREVGNGGGSMVAPELPTPLSPTLAMMRRPATSGTVESSCVGDCTRVKRDHEGEVGKGGRSIDRKGKALDGSTALPWGLRTPRMTWTGPDTTQQAYTFTQEKPQSVTIENSFFYAIVSQGSRVVFGVGKVAHCRV